MGGLGEREKLRKVHRRVMSLRSKTATTTTTTTQANTQTKKGEQTSNQKQSSKHTQMGNPKVIILRGLSSVKELDNGAHVSVPDKNTLHITIYMYLSEQTSDEKST